MHTTSSQGKGSQQLCLLGICQASCSSPFTLNKTFSLHLHAQVKSVKVRDSKFGPALVIETTPASGGYVLGFKVDPKVGGGTLLPCHCAQAAVVVLPRR